MMSIRPTLGLSIQWWFLTPPLGSIVPSDMGLDGVLKIAITGWEIANHERNIHRGTHGGIIHLELASQNQPLIK